MILPKAFLTRMKNLLGDEYKAFLAAYDKPVYRGIRWNSLKCSFETLEKSMPVSLAPAKFSQNSFYVPSTIKLGNLVAHHAGMFYAQEPSASAAVTILAPTPGEKILDLCAAPGGKATQIAAALKGKGLIWANEIVRERANRLLSNIERMGISNAVVSSLHPEQLSKKLAGFFDKVLVDAPCSGEGMFKKEPQAISEWSEESVWACARRQRSILDTAAALVKADGILVYSTCTFSREENEDTILSFLAEHPEFELLPISMPFGRPAFGMPALRIFPMDGGEGHFVAKLRKTDHKALYTRRPFTKKRKTSQESAWECLYTDLFYDSPPSGMTGLGNRIFLLPDLLPDLTGLPVLRAGVLFGEVKGSRIEPAHSLFMSRSAQDCRRVVDFDVEDPTLKRFLRGEEIACTAKDYTAVSVNGVVTGFGKASGGRLKNRYPKGLRIRNDGI